MSSRLDNHDNTGISCLLQEDWGQIVGIDILVHGYHDFSHREVVDGTLQCTGLACACETPSRLSVAGFSK